MASFLSFVYRRQSSAPSSFQSHSPTSAVVSPDRRRARMSLQSRTANTDHAPRPFLPPGVTSSGSSESAGWVSPGDSSEDEGFITSPYTPEGLLPRKSADSLRRELEISPRALEPSMKETRLSGVAKILAGNSNPIIVNDVANDSMRRHYSEDEEDMILPPPDYLQRRQPTFDSSAKSPTISTSSFYSRSQQQDRPVAMSPVLQVGQARTAVGALVALREAANRHPNAVPGDIEPYPPMEPSDKLQKEENHLKKPSPNSSKQTFPLGVLPPRSDLAATEKHQEDHETEAENVPYMPVNTPLQQRRHSIDQVRRVISEEDDELYASPSSMQLPQDQYPLSEAARKGLDTSFSSRAGLMTGQAKRESYDFDPIQSGSDNVSVSQASSLLSLGKVEEASGAEGPSDYDFNEEEFDEALMARKWRNQQIRKKVLQQKQLEEEEEEWVGDEEDYQAEEEGEEDLDHNNPDSTAIVPFDEDKYAVQDANYVDFDEALVRRKARNQRHEKEAALLDVVARLRDNLELVADIEEAASSTLATMGSWFVKTPMDDENLMTGFSVKQRDALIGSIDSILQEMEIAQPEEFIVTPTKVPVLATSHDTLTQALHFCRTLIASAIPFSEKNTMVLHLPADDPLSESQRIFLWKCLPELRNALGLVAPQSPDTVRGGGTSLFSLPEESGVETPHTSNVSMATSITSAYTPHRRRISSSYQPLRPQLILQQDGLQLRHTVEVVSSLLQKLTLASLQLRELNSKEAKEKKRAASAQIYVRACEEIKHNYLQLLAIKKEDARALTDIFYLESLTPQAANTCNLFLSREVSVDEEDPKVAAKTAKVVALASALVTTTFPNTHHNNSRRKHRSKTAAPKTKSIIRGKSSEEGHPHVNLFSPITGDIEASDHDQDGVPFEFDDLRRQMGSYDRDEDDCGDEQRDGPSFDDYGSRDSEESEWSRRMYHNVSLAASSMRSLGKPEQRE